MPLAFFLVVALTLPTAAVSQDLDMACGPRAVYLIQHYYGVGEDDTVFSIVSRFGSEYTEQGVSMLAICRDLTKSGIPNRGIAIDDLARLKVSEPCIVSLECEDAAHFAVLYPDKKSPTGFTLWDGLGHAAYDIKNRGRTKVILTGDDARSSIRSTVRLNNWIVVLVASFTVAVAVYWRWLKNNSLH